jgi:hypothetical protein
VIVGLQRFTFCDIEVVLRMSFWHQLVIRRCGFAWHLSCCVLLQAWQPPRSKPSGHCLQAWTAPFGQYMLPIIDEAPLSREVVHGAVGAEGWSDTMATETELRRTGTCGFRLVARGIQ